MRYLIVHAHHEPRSFNGAQTRTAIDVLTEAGHEVEVSDLYASGFDPVSDRRNFTTVADASYLKQQAEESHATEHGGFEPDLEAEIVRLERCDVLIFQFPLWWFGMPAILKGWCDRVLAMGRVYGNGRWYENGLGAGRRALVSMTTGGPSSMYDGHGLNPDVRTMLAPIQHGVFWFNGFQTVEPFITWAPARLTDEERQAALRAYASHVLHIDERPVVPHLPTTAFEGGGIQGDRWPRFMVNWRLGDDLGDGARDQLEASSSELATWRIQGHLLDSWVGRGRTRGGFLMRDESEVALRRRLESLPLARGAVFEMVEVERPDSAVTV